MSPKQIKIGIFCLIVFCVFVTAGFYVLSLWMKADLGVGMLPPENYTSTTMHPLKRRIHLYIEANNKLPSTLEELPLLKGFSDRVVDVWGNKIVLKIEGTEISLISYGKDQIPGGIGENLDVIGIFNARINDNSWANEDSPWMQKPLHNK